MDTAEHRTVFRMHKERKKRIVSDFNRLTVLTVDVPRTSSFPRASGMRLTVIPDLFGSRAWTIPHREDLHQPCLPETHRLLSSNPVLVQMSIHLYLYQSQNSSLTEHPLAISNCSSVLQTNMRIPPSCFPMSMTIPSDCSSSWFTWSSRAE